MHGFQAMSRPVRLPISGAFVNQFLERTRCSPSRALAALNSAGIDTVLLADPAHRVSEHQFTSLLIALSRASRDEFWGFGSRPIPLGSFKTFCRLIVKCRTLEEALVAGGRFYQLVLPDFALKIRGDNDLVVVWLKLRASNQADFKQHEMQGASLFMIYQLMCWLTDRRLPLESVHFAFGERPRSSEIVKAYESSIIRFEEPFTGLAFKKHMLALPILADERRLQVFLSKERRGMPVRFHDVHRIDDKVKTLLRRNPGKHIELEEIASDLNLTPVTLRRRLAEECGLTYSELRDAAKRTAALDMVANPIAKLEDVATVLGFSEYSAFHRAFRRWTALSPTEFRGEAVDRFV